MQPKNPSLPYSSYAPGIDRLLVVRLGSMGDVIHTLPAVAALRQAFPRIQIGWALEQRWVDLLSLGAQPTLPASSSARPLVDHIHVLKTRNWGDSLLSPTTWQEIADAVSCLRASQYNVAIDFQGAIRSASIAHLSGASAIYGFAQVRETPAGLLYTRRVPACGVHIVEQNLSLASALAGRELPLPDLQLPRLAHSEGSSVQQEPDRTPYMIINPGAGWGAKQWPAERYGVVSRRIFQEIALPSLVNSGPGEEALARTVEAESQGNARRMSCSLAELIALTGGARLFLGGDTGPMHLAAALKIPVVAIFGPTNPARNGPFRTTSIVLRSPASFTSHKHRPQADQAMLEISVEDVVSAVLRLWKETCA